MRLVSRRTTAILSVVLTSATAFGCGSEKKPPADGTGGAPAAAECPEAPGYSEPVEPQRVDWVTAQLVDADGSGVGEEFVQLCGLDVCLNGKTTPRGGLKIDAGTLFRKPALKPGEGLQTVRFALLLPANGEPTVALGEVRTVRMPALGSGAALVAGSVVSSGGLSLELAENAEIEIDQLTFRTPEQQQLRALRIEPAALSQIIPEELGFELVYAASPPDTLFCPAAKLLVENTANFEAGSRIGVFLHGVDVEERFAPYGGWAQVAEARVSDDGASIETSDGLPMLGLLGFKRL